MGRILAQFDGNAEPLTDLMSQITSEHRTEITLRMQCLPGRDCLFVSMDIINTYGGIEGLIGPPDT
jgi:hypothetical protein